MGFIRSHGGQRILVAFNLSEQAVLLPLDRFGTIRLMPESGFRAELSDAAANLPAHGALFAEIDSVWANVSGPALAEA